MATHVQRQWQLLLCFAIVACSVAASLWTMFRKKSRHAASSSTGGQPHVDSGGVAFDLSVTWRSRWSGVHPACLLAFRATAVVALAAVLLWDVRTYDPSIMMYYTEWTFLLEIVYFGAATLFSAYGCFMCSRHRTNEPESNGRLLCNSRMEIKDGAERRVGRYLGRFMQTVYQVVALATSVCGGAVVLTDVVFWALIVPFMSSAHFRLNAVMGCMHSFNLVFLLTETALDSLAFPWFKITYFVLWTCSYVIFQWIAHVCGLTWWPYPFLNPTAPWAPIWYFSMALLHLPCYLVYLSIVRAKNWCHHVVFPH